MLSKIFLVVNIWDIIFSQSNEGGIHKMSTHPKANDIKLVGYITSSKEEIFTFNHEVNGEKFYSFTLEVERQSGTKDYLPIIASEKLIDRQQTYENTPICIIGQFRSYNQIDGDSRHLVLYVFAQNLFTTDDDDNDMNDVCINGFLCKKPTLRTTPLGRQIADLLIAVPRLYGKSDYIPCVAWGRNAVYAARFDIGSSVNLTGRLQSREYQKCINDIPTTKIAYEVSIINFEGE